MFASFKVHRVLSVVVFVIATVWILTGQFSAVGQDQVTAAPAASTEPEVIAPTALRTVAAIEPAFFEHRREIHLFGATEADKSAVLAARSNGIVGELSVVQGRSIAAGENVVQLEGADVMAEVATAKAKLDQAAQILSVGEELFARGSLAELELNARRASKSAAEAALSQALASADRLSLKAPFAGLVDSVLVEVGEWVQQGTPIATILSLDPIVVKAEVSEQDVGFVTIGETARVLLVGGVEMDGTIRYVARQANERTRTFEVDVVLPNPDLTIPAGTTAEVRLFGAPETAILVPRSVITLSDAGDIGVRVVGSDNRAQFAPVKLIDDTAKGMIIAGVPQGVRVITAGQDLVRDGDEVIVADVTTDTVKVTQ